jgi:2-iminoacetate synthase ThiH
MTKRAARITETEISRAIRAAKKAGATEVEVRLGDNAYVRIPLAPDKPVAETEEIVL